MKTITPQQVALWGIIAAAVVAFIVNGPRMVKEIREHFRNKRQNRVRDVLLKVASAHRGDFMFHSPKLSQSQLEKALDEMARSGELVNHQDHAGRTMWRFKVHPREVRR